MMRLRCFSSRWLKVVHQTSENSASHGTLINKKKPPRRAACLSDVHSCLNKAATTSPTVDDLGIGGTHKDMSLISLGCLATSFVSPMSGREGRKVLPGIDQVRYPALINEVRGNRLRRGVRSPFDLRHVIPQVDWGGVRRILPLR